MNEPESQLNWVQWIIAILALLGCAVLVSLFGDVFRANILLLLGIWLVLPLLSLFLYSKRVSFMSELGIRDLQIFRIVFMIVVCAVSFYVAFGWDDIRNYIGKTYIQGYRWWRGGSDYDDLGQPYYTGDEWDTATNAGWWALTTLRVISLALSFGLPWITWQPFKDAISHIEDEQLRARL